MDNPHPPIYNHNNLFLGVGGGGQVVDKSYGVDSEIDKGLDLMMNENWCKPQFPFQVSRKIDWLLNICKAVWVGGGGRNLFVLKTRCFVIQRLKRRSVMRRHVSTDLIFTANFHSEVFNFFFFLSDFVCVCVCD